MNPEIDTGGFPIVRLGLGEYMYLTKRANTVENESEENTKGHRRELPPIVLEFGRAACWFLALACFLSAVFLSILRWVHTWSAPVGVISWCTLGVTIFIVSAHAIRASIHHRKIVALSTEIHADIQDHAPADAIELARIATTVARVSTEVTKLREDQERHSGAKEVGALHDRLDQLADLLTLTMGQVARKAYAAGIRDVLAAAQEQRREDAARNDGLLAESAPAGDHMDAELRGFLAGRMYRDDPPGTDHDPVP